GRPCVEVTDDASPQGGRTVALWEPPLMDGVTGENEAPVRRPAPVEASGLMASLVVEGARTLTFVRSRAGAESAALRAREQLSSGHGARGRELAGQIAAYRSGYLADDRRRLERGLAEGELVGVASTSALELGVDISGLDAVVSAGFPGTIASFWQQAGRAGRRGQGALVVLVARDDPLDTYLVHHPEALLGRPVEATVTDPRNPVLLAGQLRCAVPERRLGRHRRPRGPGGGRPGPAAPVRLVPRRRRPHPARRGRHPRHWRRRGGDRGLQRRSDARHHRCDPRAVTGPPGRAVPAPGRIVRGGRAGPRGRARTVPPGVTRVDHLRARAGLDRPGGDPRDRGGRPRHPVVGGGRGDHPRDRVPATPARGRDPRRPAAGPAAD